MSFLVYIIIFRDLARIKRCKKDGKIILEKSVIFEKRLKSFTDSLFLEFSKINLGLILLTNIFLAFCASYLETCFALLSRGNCIMMHNCLKQLIGLPCVILYFLQGQFILYNIYSNFLVLVLCLTLNMYFSYFFW